MDKTPQIQDVRLIEVHIAVTSAYEQMSRCRSVTEKRNAFSGSGRARLETFCIRMSFLGMLTTEMDYQDAVELYPKMKIYGKSY